MRALRQLLFSTIACLVPVAAGAQSVAVPPQTATTVAAILRHIGVDTHLGYTDGYGMYSNLATLERALSYLGIGQLRDGLPSNQTSTWPGYVAAANIERLSHQGDQFDLILPDYTQGIGDDQANLDQLFAGVGGEYAAPALAKGSLVVLEGLNEITNEVPSPTIAEATAWQQKILCLTRAASFCPAGSVDGNVKGTLVAEFTSNGPVTATSRASTSFPADLMNAHPYADPSNLYGEPVSTIISNAFSETFGVTTPLALTEQGVAAASPGAIITEAGAFQEPYAATRNDLQYLNSYDAHTMAIKDLDTVLGGVAIGAHTYLYQLFDNYSDDSDNQYGLFTYGGVDGNGNPVPVPTPAATSLHNLVALISPYRTVPTASACLAHTLSGLPAGARSMTAILDNGGDFALFVWWDNPADWNPGTHQEVPVAAVPVTISLPVGFTGSVYDPIVGASAISSFGETNAIRVMLGDDPLVIEGRAGSTSHSCS